MSATTKKSARGHKTTTPNQASGKAPTSAPKDVWYKHGIQFECQGSGQCCVSHGEYGFVYVTAADRKRMAKLRGIPTSEFTKKFCLKEEGLFRLKDGDPIRLTSDPKEEPAKPCVFLEKKRCTIYSARPAQCRTWPFWPETMSAKAWTKDVAKFCPGVGKGRVWSREEIDALVKEQTAWESDVAHGL